MSSETSQIDKVGYGLPMRKALFNLDPEYYFTNHGSYGSVPKPIFNRKIQLQLEIDQSPDKWFRYTSFELWKKNVKSIAKYLNVESEKMVICDNATEAINAVVKAIEFNGANDAILATQYTYQAILNTIDYISKYRLAETNHIQVFKVDIKFPIASTNEFLDEFEKTCKLIVDEKKLRLRLAVIDHIASATAIMFPIDKIMKIIRKWSQVYTTKFNKSNDECLILIDGAHAIGQVKLDLNSMDCDFYVSNMHKWFLAPRGCSFLYLKSYDKIASTLQPNYISHGYNKDVNFNFYSRATCDKTSWFLVDECIKYYEDYLGGWDSINEYNSKILQQAVDILVNEWNTSRLNIPRELEAPFMKVIKLPLLKNYTLNKDQDDQNVVISLMRDLYLKHNIISCVVIIQNELYIRISCFVYNSIDEYIVLKNAIKDLIENS